MKASEYHRIKLNRNTFQVALQFFYTKESDYN